MRGRTCAAIAARRCTTCRRRSRRVSECARERSALTGQGALGSPAPTASERGERSRPRSRLYNAGSSILKQRKAPETSGPFSIAPAALPPTRKREVGFQVWQSKKNKTRVRSSQKRSGRWGCRPLWAWGDGGADESRSSTAVTEVPQVLLSQALWNAALSLEHVAILRFRADRVDRPRDSIYGGTEVLCARSHTSELLARG